MRVAPRISLITPAHNVAPFIGPAIRSVLAQGLADWEMLVVDDGSTDGTAGVVAGYRDPRVRLFVQANQGVSAARSRALAELRGQAVLFLDADDWLAPDALPRLWAALAGAPAAVGAHGGHAVVAEAAQPGDRPLRLKPGPPGGELLPRLLWRNPFVNGGQLLVRRAAVARAGGFRPGLRFAEDWDYWVRLALLGPFAAVPGPPVLFARERRGSAYRRMARDPAAFTPAMAAVFGNPALEARFGPVALARFRARAEAENAWIQGRELLRHGARAEGLARLRASVAAAPGAKRALLAACAHVLPGWGPFAPYPP